MSTPHIVGRNAMSTSVIDGTREDEPAVAVEFTYTCLRGHETVVALWEHATVPDTWKCRVCSHFASRAGVEGAETGPWRPATVPYWRPKSHIDQLYERRTNEELEALLQERVTLLRLRRGEVAA